MALNLKQAAFVAEYIVDLNATQAAIRAGYSKKTAYSQGQRLLKHVEIQEEIQKYRQKASQGAVASLQEVLESLTEIGRAKVGDYFDKSGVISFDAIKATNPGAIEAVKQVYDGLGNPVVQIKLHSKIAAWERLAKLMGWDAPAKADLQVTYGVPALPGDVKIEGEQPEAQDDGPDQD